MTGGAPTWNRPVYVVGAGAVSGSGVGWRGLAALAPTIASPRVTVPPLPPEHDPCEKRQRKLMSRAAYLGAAAVKAALADAGWAGTRDAGLDIGLDIGLYMGVGASGGDMGELEAMLAASVRAGTFDLGRFGSTGLAAANPLYAFQLMNNFTLCHGAILAGLEGPNAAFYSRGAGTVTALREAAFAVAGGETARALAGGADSALHLVTASELAREGWTAAGLAPAEGGALLALAEAAPGAECPRLLRAEVLRAPGRPLGELAARALAAEPPTHPVVFVLGGWGPAAASALRQSLAHYPGASIDATALFGEALAAAPALAWVLALDWLANRAQGRAVVLTAGIDGALGVVSFAKEIP